MYGRRGKYVFIFINWCCFIVSTNHYRCTIINTICNINKLFGFIRECKFKKMDFYFFIIYRDFINSFWSKILDDIHGLLLVFVMAYFYGLSQVFSRSIKDLDVKFTNSLMGFVGFIILITFSHIFEGNIIDQIKKLNLLDGLRLFMLEWLFQFLAIWWCFIYINFIPLEW